MVYGRERGGWKGGSGGGTGWDGKSVIESQVTRLIVNIAYILYHRLICLYSLGKFGVSLGWCDMLSLLHLSFSYEGRGRNVFNI